MYIAFGVETIDQIYYQGSFFRKTHIRTCQYLFFCQFILKDIFSQSLTHQTLWFAWWHTLTNELRITCVHINLRISTTNLQNTSGFVLLTEKQCDFSISKNQSKSVVDGVVFQLLRRHQVHSAFGTLDQISTLLFFIFARISHIWHRLFAYFLSASPYLYPYLYLCYTLS